MSRRLLLALLLVAAGAAGATAAGVLDGEKRPAGGETGPESAGLVVRVVDGDTIHVQVGATREAVRYIGIDTPETKHPSKGVQCYGEQAAQFNARLVAGERVRLVRDVEPRDRYGRLLAYVYRVRDGLFVNAELARLGFAAPLAIAPDVRFAGRFEELARQARERHRGRWSACRGAAMSATLP